MDGQLPFVRETNGLDACKKPWYFGSVVGEREEAWRIEKGQFTDMS